VTNYEHKQDNSAVADADHIVFSVKDCLLGLPYYDIIQIVDSPHCTSVPNTPRYVRGVIEFMGEAIPLIETRVLLSMKSLREEVVDFIDTFMTRKQDHINWIARLVDSVENDKEITVEKDPHKCAFGIWYDTFKPNTLTLSSYMQRFDKPHKAIHNLAVKSEELVREGRKDMAKEMIHNAQSNELKELISLFDGFEEQMRLSYQEYVIVIARNGYKFALSVDSIKYFDRMDSIVSDVPLFGNINKKMIKGIGRKKIGDASEDVIILDLDNLFDTDAEQI